MKAAGTINNIGDLHSIVNGIQMGRITSQYKEFYRGQARDTYKLTPNLARKIKTPDELKQVEKDIIAEFKQRVTDAGKADKMMLSADPRRNEWEWIGQAQHYRLPTRFMDWTISGEVALYFAIGNSTDNDDSDSQFWAFLAPLYMFKTDGEQDEFFHQHPFAQKESIFLNPAFFWTGEYNLHIAEKRRAVQYGRFSITSHEHAIIPIEDNPELNKYLRMYVIPKEAKPQLRKFLSGKDYSDESIYVEEDDVINQIVQDLRKKYNV